MPRAPGAPVTPDAVLINAANLLVLCSFLARDILYLRVLSIGAGLCFIGFYLAIDPVVWEGIAWNLVFMGINAVQIARLLRERRPVQLTADEARLQGLLGEGLSARDIQRLSQAGTWQDLAPGAELLVQEELSEGLWVVLTGRLGVFLDGREVAELRPGMLVGEMGWISRQPASAGVRATVPSRCLRWEQAALEAALAESPSLEQAMQAIVGRDLAQKVREGRTVVSLAEAS